MVKNRVYSDRRKMGVVYTPDSISRALTKAALDSCPEKRLRILEPSAGDGSFLRAIVDITKKKHQISAVDIDEDIVASLAAKFDTKYSTMSEFISADFIDFSLAKFSRRYDLIIGNPPFIRNHNFSEELKASIARLSLVTGFEKKHLKNAWAAFIVAAEGLLRSDGVLAFVVPYELVNVDYGIVLQNQIFSKFDRVDIYLPSKRAFETIEQDAVAIVCRKKTTLAKGIYAHGVKSLQQINDHKATTLSGINLANSDYVALSTKSYLLDSEAIELIVRLKSLVPPLSKYCKTAPGIVTGANDFFIVTKAKMDELQLNEWCRPILKKGSYLPHTPVLSEDGVLQFTSKHPAYLLDIGGIPIEKLPKHLQEYLSSEEAQQFSQRYKCRNRNPWYSVPIVNAKPAFFFKRSYRYPRIVVNSAEVLVTDTAYGITPSEKYTAKGICFSFYNSMSLLFTEIDGRFYGGGVLELTPKEFRSLPVSYLEPSPDEFSNFLDLHKVEGDTAKIVARFGNKWLSQNLSLSNREISLLESSWMRLRNHRLRHGGNSKSSSSSQ